ncbi:MAG: hypothetical protein WED04_06730 [Promethearchaeati archaeon SRVP18_Atabeyarchaeia-1]
MPMVHGPKRSRRQIKTEDDVTGNRAHPHTREEAEDEVVDKYVYEEGSEGPE